MPEIQSAVRRDPEPGSGPRSAAHDAPPTRCLRGPVAHSVPRAAGPDALRRRNPPRRGSTTALPRFSGRSSARTWLLSIARRVVVDQIRHKQSRPRTQHGIDVEQVLESYRPVGGFEKMVEIRLLLDGLDEVTRNKRDTVIRQITELSEKYRANQFMVSCRGAAYNVRINVAAMDDKSPGEPLVADVVELVARTREFTAKATAAVEAAI